MAQGHADARRPVRPGAGHAAEPVHRLPAHRAVRPRVRHARATTCRATSPPTATPARPPPRRARSGARTSPRTSPAAGPGGRRWSAGRGWPPIPRRRASRWPASTGPTGTFEVLPTDKKGRDFRAHGRLQYVGGHYLRFAGTGGYFLKAGADAPETLLGYADFDGTVARRPDVPLKTWAPHVRDWRPGDPTWKGGKGKGLIGALNYLASRGVNAFSFLTYNAGGDGDNVWPFVERDDKLHYDCSKLDQWQIVFDHAQSLGLYLHFKTQETEIDDQRCEHQREAREVPEALDGGGVGAERRLYYRELVARFGHELALNWNLGEENTQTPEEQRAMAETFSRARPLPPPRRDPHLPGRAGPRLHAAARRGIEADRGVAPEPLGRGAPARAEVAARVGEGRASRGWSRTTSRATPPSGCRPTRASRGSPGARRRRAGASTTSTTSVATPSGAR